MIARTWLEDLCCESLERNRCRHHRVRASARICAKADEDRLYMMYLPLRLYGLTQGDDTANDYALSILCCESSLLFPR
jgi:hypothetical protein